VQEQRAGALEAGHRAVSILIAPVEAVALRLFDRDYYAGLAVTLRRGEEVDVEVLTRTWPAWVTRRWTWWRCGQFTRRAEFWMCIHRRPIGRCASNFFGDEIETIRNSIPKRSARRVGLDEGAIAAADGDARNGTAAGAVHARLEPDRVESPDAVENEEMAAEMAAAGGVSVFPGGSFSPRGRGENRSCRWRPSARSLWRAGMVAIRLSVGGNRWNSGMSGPPWDR